MVSDLLRDAEKGSALDRADPSELPEIIADVLPGLADEFDAVKLRISHECVPHFCKVLRQGMIKRSIRSGDDKEQINPDDFELPKRIEHYALFHKSVEMQLPAEMALLLAEDLRSGLQG